MSDDESRRRFRIAGGNLGFGHAQEGEEVTQGAAREVDVVLGEDGLIRYESPAVERILETFTPLADHERVPLDSALGRVLVEDVPADITRFDPQGRPHVGPMEVLRA